MMNADLDALLRELEGSSHTQRMATVVARTRALSSRPEARQALCEGLLTHAEATTRVWGVLMASVAGDVARLRRAREDESSMVRRMAASSLIDHDSDAEDLARWFLAADQATRRTARTHLLRRRRGDVAQRLIEPLMQRGEHRDAQALLALCPAPLMEAVGEPAGERAGEASGAALGDMLTQLRWKHLSVVNLPLAQRHLTRSLQEATSDAARFWAWHHHAPTALQLALHQPQALMALLQEHAPRQAVAPLGQALTTLMRRQPQAMGQWLLQERAQAWTSWLLGHRASRDTLRALGPEVLAALARQRVRDAPLLGRLLKSVPPAMRGLLFEQACQGQDVEAMEWGDSLLESLPRWTRHAWAARQLERRAVRQDPLKRGRAASFLSPEEAKPILAPMARGATAEDRAAGLAWLIHAARRHRQGLASLLAELEPRLKNEQDPVRQSALLALGQAPGWMFEPAAISPLLRIVEALTQARDTSSGTRHACAQVAYQLLRAEHAQAQAPALQGALAMLRLLAGQEAMSWPYGLGRRMSPRVASTLIQAVLEPLARGAQRNAYREVIGLANALGKLAWTSEPLQALLEESIWATPSFADSALPLWLACPATRDARVARALARDPSVVVHRPVWQHLHRRRQDLLDPFIQGQPLRGRFASQTVGWVFPAQDGFERWLPRQQRALAQVLRRLIEDEGHTLSARVAAIRPLGAMPIHGPHQLLALTQSEQVPICEAALGALIWTDRPGQALEILLEHVSTDRARVAMYAIARVSRFVSQQELLTRMEALLARPVLKVTVLKEALRLIGGVGGPRAALLVHQVWQRPGLHRDARIAALHAARGLLDQELAWQMLEQGARQGDVYSALALAEVQPLSVPARHRARMARVMVSLAEHPEARAQRALYEAMSRPAYGVGDWLELAQAAILEAAAQATQALDQSQVWRAAMGCLVEGTRRQPTCLEPLRRTLVTLVERSAQERLDPEPRDERDMPATQRLGALVQALRGAATSPREPLARALPELAQALGAPEHHVLAAQLRLASHGVRERQPQALVAQILVELDAAQGDPVRQALQPDVEQACAQALCAPGALAQAEAVEQTLLALDGLLVASVASAQRVALQALLTLGPAQQWGEPWRERLVRLRRAADPGVRALALQRGAFAWPE